MNNFVILMYEDEVDWKISFEYSLKARMMLKGSNLTIIHRENGDTIEQDLTVYYPHLIMVDHDLGETTGAELISIIDTMPEHKSVSIYYYSGGESLDDLRHRASKFMCQIRCFTKEGDELHTAVMGLV